MASSKRRGLLTEMMVMTPGTRGHLVERDAARDGHHAYAVERAARADGGAMISAVRVHEVRAVGVEVARVRRQIHRRADLVADQVDRS